MLNQKHPLNSNPEGSSQIWIPVELLLIWDELGPSKWNISNWKICKNRVSQHVPRPLWKVSNSMLNFRNPLEKRKLTVQSGSSKRRSELTTPLGNNYTEIKKINTTKQQAWLCGGINSSTFLENHDHALQKKSNNIDCPMSGMIYWPIHPLYTGCKGLFLVFTPTFVPLWMLVGTHTH